MSDSIQLSGFSSFKMLCVCVRVRVSECVVVVMAVRQDDSYGEFMSKW